MVRSQINKLKELGVFQFGNLTCKETIVFVVIFIGIYRPPLYLHEFIVGYGLWIPIYVFVYIYANKVKTNLNIQLSTNIISKT